MASFNSYHGRKLHKEMLTDTLVGGLGFGGFVVGDWNGHGQVSGCTNASCAASFNAGLDMFMASDSWKGLYVSMLDQVRSGEVSMERLEQAVARILRVKCASASGLVSVVPADHEVQEDTLIVTWSDAVSLIIEGRPVDFARESHGDMALYLTYQVLDAPAGKVTVEMGGGMGMRAVVDVTDALTRQAGQGWQTGQLLLSCFADAGLNMDSVSEPLVIKSDSRFELQIAMAGITENTGSASCQILSLTS